MKKLDLSKRLETVANMVEPTAFLVDIGCDHGFLAIRLVESGKVQKAMCTDINEGPLARASEHIKEAGLEDKIQTVLSDGLNSVDITNLFTASTICGMGGLMSVKIIYESDDFFRKMEFFYLQIQSDYELVRMFLHLYGYKIQTEETVFEDGKYYTVMKIVPCSDKMRTFYSLNEVVKTITDEVNKLDISEAVDFYYPYYLGRDMRTFVEFIDFMINKYTIIKENLPINSARKPEIERLLDIMRLGKERTKNYY